MATNFIGGTAFRLVGSLLLGWFCTFCSAAELSLSDGWSGVAARNEIKPSFSVDPQGGASKNGALVIRADGREGLDGHWEKSFPIVGSRHYRFRVKRHTTGVPIPRRSALVRILWRDAGERPVRHDAPGAHSFAPDTAPAPGSHLHILQFEVGDIGVNVGSLAAEM